MSDGENWAAEMNARSSALERAQRIQATNDAAAPVIADLQRSGVPVISISQLLERGQDIRPAIPVLIDWLPRVQNDAVKELIARVLTDRRARVATRPLLVEFRRADAIDQRSLKWALGNALEAVADDSIIDDLLELVTDRQQGTGRQMLVVALGRSADPRVPEALVRLLDDDEVAGHALVALKRLARPDTRAHIARFATHENVWYRREATKGLARIDAKSGESQ